MLFLQAGPTEAHEELALALSRGLELDTQRSSRESIQCSSGYSTQTNTPCCSEDTIPSQGSAVSLLIVSSFTSFIIITYNFSFCLFGLSSIRLWLFFNGWRSGARATAVGIWQVLHHPQKQWHQSLVPTHVPEQTAGLHSRPTELTGSLSWTGLLCWALPIHTYPHRTISSYTYRYTLHRVSQFDMYT